MEKRLLGASLILLGMTGMFLSGYHFITGTGTTSNLIAVMIYLITGAAMFFTGINVTMPANKFVHKSPIKTEYSPLSENP